jgi:LysR family glycine cleavage system transcriptional activator
MSYQIKLLEDRVGGPLFLRQPRGVALTERGRRLAPAVSEAFAQLRTAFDALNESADNVLSITSLGTFATNWLVPHLGAFQLLHPEIAVRLDASNAMVDFAAEDFDVGIRSGHGKWPGLMAHELLSAAFTPLASPRLLARHAPLEEPADLLKLPLIDPGDPWWVDWFVAAGVPEPDLSKRVEMRVENQQLAGRAALGAQGAAILMPAFFAEELAAGQLVQPFPLMQEAEGVHYWLVYPEARRRAPKIRAFRDWILAEIADPRGA